VFIYIAGEEQNTREGEEREGCSHATILSAYTLHNPVLATGIYHAAPQLRQLWYPWWLA